MGYNASVIVQVDALDQIANDPEFGKKLVEAIKTVNLIGSHVDRRFSDVSAGNHLNAASVIAVNSADMVSVVYVGSNYGTEAAILTNGNEGHHTYQDKVRLLKKFAASMCYRTVKIT